MAEQVILREVGLRDGIQMAKCFLDTKHKLDWALRSQAAGIREMELTSFVPAKVVPQFADAEELAKYLPQLSGIVASALVPNLKGVVCGTKLKSKYLDSPTACLCCQGLDPPYKTWFDCSLPCCACFANSQSDGP